jgi:hypothetical protein
MYMHGGLRGKINDIWGGEHCGRKNWTDESEDRVQDQRRSGDRMNALLGGLVAFILMAIPFALFMAGVFAMIEKDRDRKNGR